ncbi:hypothetical protein HGRIS_014040 [Hohenbuehelia grisea]|uniref:BTB domain-containing protein n=1 Tax=Hohenbuehelia grisea TaxID=104357 RepID=A0ABR3JTK5_9AGAR
MDDMEDTQDRKRPRVDYDNAEETKPFVNHPSLYFDDGNLILQCKDAHSTTRTLFCVHRSLVAKHSSVFKDIFDAAYAREPQERFRGLAVVHLDEDDKDDLAGLLATIYDGYDVKIPAELTIETFPELAGLLRITTKYNLDRARALILARLRLEWPTTLAAHDIKRVAFAEKVRAQADDTIVHPAAVIALLRECGYTNMDLLAPLFYDLSTRVWQLGPGVRGHHLAPLVHAEMERLVFGLNQVRCRHVALAQCPPTAGFHQACAVALIAEWKAFAVPVLLRRQNDMCEPVEDWGVLEATWGGRAEKAVCARCDDLVRASIREARRILWDSLATSFS